MRYDTDLFLFILIWFENVLFNELNIHTANVMLTHKEI